MISKRCHGLSYRQLGHILLFYIIIIIIPKTFFPSFFSSVTYPHLHCSLYVLCSLVPGLPHVKCKPLPLSSWPHGAVVAWTTPTMAVSVCDAVVA